MVSSSSNCVKLNNLKEIEENLALVKMGEHDTKVEDVEEGEISDTTSVEEITEQDFNKQDVKVTKETKPNGDARVWAVHDLYTKYPTICRGYASGLYNLAWAQAVQNKPLNDIFVMEVDSKRRSSSPSLNDKEKEVERVIIDDSGDEMDVKVVDVDKEEGELEEGEIDMDAEPAGKDFADTKELLICQNLNIDTSEFIPIKGMDLEKQVNVRQELESITVINAEKSFDETCCRLKSALESLLGVFSGSNLFENSEDYDIIEMSFDAIKVVNSVFWSMNNWQREKNKESILRFLSFVKNRDRCIFSSEQMKEIECMITSLCSLDALSSGRAIDKEELQIDELKNKEISAVSAGQCISSSKPSDTIAMGTLVSSNSIGVSEELKSGQSAIKGRGALLPLLDLHKDHDVDSLPSPTREAPSHFPVYNAFSVGEGMVKAGLPAAKLEGSSEGSKLHLYETDALKAVSSYQQKFGRSSFSISDKLPSPTPSDDCEDGVVDTSEEVSSTSMSGSSRSIKPSLLEQPAVPSTTMDGSGTQGPITSKIEAPTSSGSYPIKSSAKSRDPRLRFINSDASSLDLNQHPALHSTPKLEHVGTVISRKQKVMEEPGFDEGISKRQKSALENPKHNSRDIRTISGISGRLEDATAVGSQLIDGNHLVENVETEPRKSTSAVNGSYTNSGNFSATSNGNEQAPVASTNTTASLPALMKDPTMLLNLLIGQQQRLVAETMQKSADPATSTVHPPISSPVMGIDPTVSVSQTLGLLQKVVGTHLVSSQATSTAQSLQDDLGKIRMKPRDPRRILHGSTLQNSGSLGSEQFKAIVSTTSNIRGTGDNLSAQKIEVRADAKSLPSQSITPPDITRQFTKNLKNIADLLSVSQASLNHSSVTQNISSASGPLKSDRIEQKSVVSNSENLHARAGSAPEAGAAATVRSQSTWGDVEHLFEGYDEQQKAAIQRERARRIEEQKKMFSARKLCLVLDLDHTLLNSAKFVEVDPVHDEILRKKEEQDREKSQRHLFRFSHMGMWTKLRPGIWNFLEKASKLFELHLYTMGNKLYATEMAKVLDPKGVLFNGRVISKGDDGDPFDSDERVPKSKDLEGVLGMESCVVIIDDSVRVWPHNKLNLIVVERYTYFPCSRRQFGLPGPSLLEIDHDERPEDGTLASSLAVIERIHQIFFASQSLEEADVRNILASEQRKILSGCRIVFSRVFPVGEANPHLHPLWQTAEQFGAVCTNQIDEQVTHVVANSLGTDKVNWALSTGRFVVHPGWVEASALLYRRANEQDFAIKQ
ncbi:hypothetical protein L6164_015040 [Bauhinia variegata]|uniref:Uncharacterized protein n=1 Tax=Bauhinia variegata TaxID=167791 RepID=A0ACB9NJH7_BAUVA|nr:hypothetical protein L6164_015040 [Bauhinia variegata]